MCSSYTDHPHTDPCRHPKETVQWFIHQSINVLNKEEQDLICAYGYWVNP